MAIPEFLKKKIEAAQKGKGEASASDEDASASVSESGSASDEAPAKKTGKPNPLKKWAFAK